MFLFQNEVEKHGLARLARSCMQQLQALQLHQTQPNSCSNLAKTTPCIPPYSKSFPQFDAVPNRNRSSLPPSSPILPQSSPKRSNAHL
jgi:hypothetical protein